MKKLKYFLILSFTLPSTTFCQSWSGYVVSNSDKEPISYASVLNTRSGDFTFTNKQGYFNILAELQDTLLLRHVGFNSLNIHYKEQPPDTLIMKENIAVLEEIVVRPKNDNNQVIIGSKEKSQNLFGLGVNDEYIYLIENQIDEKILLQEIIIPIKYKKGYPRDGVFQFQLFASQDNGFISDHALSKSYELTIPDKASALTIALEEKIELTGDFKFYLFMKRAIPNKVFNLANHESHSVNPFLYFIETDEDSVFFDKPLNQNIWIELGEERLLQNISFIFILKGQLTE